MSQAMQPPAVEAGIPLSYYLEHWPDEALELACRGCHYRKTFPFQRVVDELKARGLGDENTGVLAVGGLMGGFCMACEDVRWVSRPKLPKPT